MTDDATPHGNTGNRHAARSENENMTAKILFDCYPEEKNAWVRASKPGKLAAWIRHQLNTATGRPDEPTEEERRHIKM